MEEVEQGQSPLKKWKLSRKTVQDFLLMHVAILMLVVGIYFFKFPNHFTMGGVAGISVVVGALIPAVSPSLVNWILSVTLLLIGFMVFGRSFGLKTTYVSLASSGLILLLSKYVPMTAPITDQPVLELFFAGFFPAAASAILFYQDASGGGTDIIAKIICRYSHINIGKALLASDAVFTLSTFFIFGTKVGLFSCAGLMMKGVLIDAIMESFNEVKAFTIVTSCPEEVGKFICQELKRSATLHRAEGLFTHEERTVFFCVVSRYQSFALRNAVKRIDPNSFITITSTSSIVGNGFRTSS